MIPESPTAANRLLMDYRREAIDLGSPPVPIIDAHTHINGAEAATLFAEVMDLYGIEAVWSMTALDEVESVRESLDGRFEPIAVPDFRDPDRRSAHGDGYLRRIEAYRAKGARIVKFWSAPRIVDFGEEAGDPAMLRLDGPIRRAGMQLATDLGMAIMIHIADPDTWFATKYADQSKYGDKRSQYEPLEAVVADYPVPFIAAHMGGWPEDLEFLDGLLSRHPNLHLDSSATKWIVRELSRHEPSDLIAFLKRHRGRILFGSDIVTLDEHLRTADKDTENVMATKASNREDAFDLYASRYWSLRRLWESDHDGESPIADPDLAMVDPERHGPLDAPRLRGMSLPRSELRMLYREAAIAFSESIPADGRPSSS
jgi:predicted TIM-barrel fold metal-dependent hydrolase